MLDVNRSLKRFPPGIDEADRPVLQDQLTRLIVRVLVAHPGLHYYQVHINITVLHLFFCPGLSRRGHHLPARGGGDHRLPDHGEALRLPPPPVHGAHHGEHHGAAAAHVSSDLAWQHFAIEPDNCPAGTRSSAGAVPSCTATWCGRSWARYSRCRGSSPGSATCCRSTRTWSDSTTSFLPDRR